MQKENFSLFGTNFQTKVLQSLFIDIKFFDRIFDILELDFFDSKPHNWIYEQFQKYFSTYKIPLTIENLEVITRTEKDELLRDQINEIIRSIKKAAINDTAFIKDQAIKFCRNQKMKKALYCSIDLWEKGKYDEIYKIVGDALKAGEESNIGHNYWNELALEYRISLMKRLPISTGLKHLDEILNGGLSRGELGVVVAGTGLGKCVGKNTKIDIEYDVFDIEFKSFKKIREEITISELFKRLNIAIFGENILLNQFSIFVKTFTGFEKIIAFKITEKMKTMTLYFTNGLTLQCAEDHRIKCNDNWKFAKDITSNDIIKTNSGTTKLIKIDKNEKLEHLYDIQVDKVSCYYTNGILSHNSWLLCSLASSAVKQKLKVVHYTLELYEHQVGLRYDTIFSGIPIEQISTQIDYVKKKLKQIGAHSNLFIKHYPPKRATINTIRIHIDRLKQQRFVPDIIVIDYADLLKPSQRYEQKRFELEGIYEELRGMAGELQVPIWTACFHGDTEIKLIDGRSIKIKDLIELSKKEKLYVYSYDFDRRKNVVGEVKSVFQTGNNQPLWKVVLDNGKHVIATANHNFLLRNGKYEQLQNLKIGDSLMPFYEKFTSDGRRMIYDNSGNYILNFKFVAEWKFGKIPKFCQIHYIDYNKFNDHPDNLEMLTISEYYRKHVDLGNQNSIANLKRLKQVCSNKMKISNSMFKKETRKKIALSMKGKFIGDKNPMKLYENKNHTITAIEFYGYDNVYNLEVDKYHNYALSSGIIVKNSQSNRASMDSDVVTLATISESFAKAAVSDVIITLSRKIEDRLKNTGRIFVAKNRAGRDGIVIPITMNLKNYKIESQKPFESIDELKNEILSDELFSKEPKMNEHKKQTYEEFKKKKNGDKNVDNSKQKSS